MNELKRNMSGMDFKMLLAGLLGALWFLEYLFHAVGIK